LAVDGRAFAFARRSWSWTWRQWDERTGQIISKIDWLGRVILVGFVVAQLTRTWVLGHWAEGVALTTLGLCVTAGTLAGQVLGTGRAVRAVPPPA
jgi:hypothetical protein